LYGQVSKVAYSDYEIQLSVIDHEREFVGAKKKVEGDGYFRPPEHAEQNSRKRRRSGQHDAHSLAVRLPQNDVPEYRGKSRKLAVGE
jgi:hypothetical protein